MTVIKQYSLGSGGGNKGGGSPFGFLGTILMVIIGLVLTYLVVKGIFTLLLWFSVPLLIGGILVDYKGALETAKKFFEISKKNLLIPGGAVLASVIFPGTVPFILMALVGGYLLARYFFKKKVKSVFGDMGMPTEKKEEDFTEYEEVSEEEDFLELPELDKPSQKTKSSGNEYDNLFD